MKSYLICKFYTFFLRKLVLIFGFCFVLFPFSDKDIRAHLNNDLYPGGLLPCDSSNNPEAAYYQMESPPCYTIATGLPTYDEALHHNQQHFAFGMKFIYPTLAAVHHQATNLISSWEKYDITNKDEKSSACTSSHKKSLKCKSSQTNNSKSLSSSLSSSLSLASSTSLSLDGIGDVTTSTSSCLLLPPSYEVAATMALLSDHVSTTTCDNVAINMPQLDSDVSAKTSSDVTDIINV